MQEEILENIRTLWELVKKDGTRSSEVAHEIERLLTGNMMDLESIKALGTEIYREVGRSGFPLGDPKRDGIRSISHFVMCYWDLRSGRAESAQHRRMVARGNMTRYFNEWIHLKQQSFEPKKPWWKF